MNTFFACLFSALMMIVSAQSCHAALTASATADSLSIYVPGTGSNAIEYRIDHMVDTSRYTDTWRLMDAYEVSPERERIRTVALGVAWECAIRESAEVDFVGTYHGYETADVHILVDGVQREGPFDPVACQQVVLALRGTIYHYGTDSPWIDFTRILTFSSNGLNLRQRVTFSTAGTLKEAFFAMLPAVRTGVTDTALREGSSVTEDVSIAGFPQIVTSGPRIFWLWGDSGISFYAELAKDNGVPAYGYVSSSAAYNKIYIGSGHNVTVGEGDIWDMVSLIRVTTTN